jgi:hypothetical protein
MVYAELLEGSIHTVTVFNRTVNSVILCEYWVVGKDLIFSIILGIIWILKTYDVRLNSIWNCIIEFQFIIESQFIIRHT